MIHPILIGLAALAALFCLPADAEEKPPANAADVPVETPPHSPPIVTEPESIGPVKKGGRPKGSKDKAPRKRRADAKPVSAAPPIAELSLSGVVA